MSSEEVRKTIQLEKAVAAGTQLAQLALWDRALWRSKNACPQVEVRKTVNAAGFERWAWRSGSDECCVSALVRGWDYARADRTLLNAANLICSCTSGRAEWCAHKIATMIVASPDPGAVYKSMERRPELYMKPYSDLTAGRK